MKCFKVIECGCLDQIVHETMTWVRKNTDYCNINSITLLNGFPTFWHNINDKENFLKENTTLVNWCKKQELHIRDVAILRAVSRPGCSNEESNPNERLHIDKGPLRTKINFPIYNTKDSYTEWYEIPDSPSFGNEPVYLGDRDLTKYKKITEVETIHPMIFNSTIPHRVRIGPEAIVPRMQLAVMFFEDLSHMLED